MSDYKILFNRMVSPRRDGPIASWRNGWSLCARFTKSARVHVQGAFGFINIRWVWLSVGFD